jgi:hypothetical protein
LSGSQDLDAKVNQITHLVLQDREVEILEMFKSDLGGRSVGLIEIDELECTLDLLVLLLRLPEKEIDCSQLQFFVFFLSLLFFRIGFSMIAALNMG